MRDAHLKRWFNVAGIDTGLERMRARGGAVQMGPHDAPCGSRIARRVDPQGGRFALVGLGK